MIGLLPSKSNRNHRNRIYDWQYCHLKIVGRTVTRAECDGLFLEIMLFFGVTGWLARTMWAAVRALPAISPCKIQDRHLLKFIRQHLDLDRAEGLGLAT